MSLSLKALHTKFQKLQDTWIFWSWRIRQSWGMLGSVCDWQIRLLQLQNWRNLMGNWKAGREQLQDEHQELYLQLEEPMSD